VFVSYFFKGRLAAVSPVCSLVVLLSVNMLHTVIVDTFEQRNVCTGRAKKSNPLRKIWYLWNCSTCSICLHSKIITIWTLTCIFQSEQVIKLRFWLKITSLTLKSPDLNQLDYHVRCILGRYIRQNQPTLPSWRLPCFNMKWFATGVHW